ncbi:MAG: UDP-N-acetylmuramoyl-L-alanyl-D-glutamate--2,6-diaminopimelate ligase [Lachnospiraceae bacterium]|nr:UDP-N-acetylmuramoyl-L-alanyl-D-glutamate--2,6-diaminopimelate ligase [Lachnospiraceae bacterium]
MKLSDLLSESRVLLKGDPETEITGIAYDTRKIQPGNLFVCIVGTVVDGHDFIDKAIELGAAAVAVTKDVTVPEKIAVIKMYDDRAALSAMSTIWFGHPAEKLITIGLTGTKGKTTTAFMIREILEEAGIPCGLIGSVENIIGDEHIPASHSTPESYVLQEYLSRMVAKGLRAVVMEVSSQGLKMHRVGGMTFDYGLFTNFGVDHIGTGEHADLAEYFACKRMLFGMSRTGIFNGDDERADDMMADQPCRKVVFGAKEGADYRLSDVTLTNPGGSLGVSYTVSGRCNMRVDVDIAGSFNAYNSIAALSLAKEMGIADEVILAVMKRIHVRGRVEPVKVSDSFSVMLDYAHNGMSLRSLLKTIREYHPKRLVCVFGCGGNRSKDRRYEMGEVSASLADLTVVTSDNPRFEEPKDIIADILIGVKRASGTFVTIEDRREAIHYVLEHAEPGDCIVIAGKGHEDYQEIRGVKYHMDDREMILEEAAAVGLL